MFTIDYDETVILHQFGSLAHIRLKHNCIELFINLTI